MAGTKAETTLEIIVNQTPGVISTNFEQLKADLELKMKEYEAFDYTEENRKLAEEELTKLRKLDGSVDTKRKEIKNECLKPYEIVEGQAKELKEILHKPIDKLAAFVKECEEKRRKEVKDSILAYMSEAFKELPADIAKKLQFAIYDEKWENKTTAKKKWQEAVQAALEKTKEEIEKLNGIEEDFRERAIEVYRIQLSFTDALLKVDEMRRDREIWERKERERIAAEERRKAEEALRREREEKARAEAEARAKAEAEARAKAEAERAAQETAVSPTTCQPAQPVEVWTETNQQTNIPAEMRQAPASGFETVEANNHTPTPQKSAEGASASAEEHKEIKTLRIQASKMQFAKIFAFIEHVGGVYREVE